jgi:hypothetical protein
MTWRVAFLTALTLCAAAAPSERFFPARPSGAVLSMQEGVLVQYRVEDLAGTVTLRIRGGRQTTSNLGKPVRIDGHAIMCKIAPTDNSAPSEACRDWPVVVGHTRVRVTYWHATKRALKGQDVLVKNEIRTLDTSAAYSSGSVVNNSG